MENIGLLPLITGGVVGGIVAAIVTVYIVKKNKKK